MYLLGYDIGTSSIKATLLDAQTQQTVATATCPKKEMQILATKPGWAEQLPDLWWDNVKAATAELLTSASVDAADIKAIGISYQMHGLVCVDKTQRVLRPSIIWCDSRAVQIGEQAADRIGRQKCLQNLLNYPGNFTASKLKWVKDNEPEIFEQIHKIMLPGDFIAMKMSGNIQTTPSGLSEGIFWDFQNNSVSKDILDAFDFNPRLLADQVETFSVQTQLSKEAAAELNLKAATPISYRAGDQPNNAFSLNVLNPGEIAATAGTSGVIYGIADSASYDDQSRVNTFVHVNHTKDAPRYGVLLCINGTGILNSWLKHNLISEGMDYSEMNKLAAQAPIGSDGLVCLPYGNGAERTLANQNIAASLQNLNFNQHDRRHVLRAAQEGIVFALNYGLEIMRDMGVAVETVRAGQANMFLSPLFAEAFATVTGSTVELYNTDGSAGAARGAGLGCGIYKQPQEAFSGLGKQATIEPEASTETAYKEAYSHWRDTLSRSLAKNEPQ